MHPTVDDYQFLLHLAYATLRLAMKHEGAYVPADQFLDSLWQPRLDKRTLAYMECDIVTAIEHTYVVHTVDTFLRG
jgi:hypothetical protein